MKPHISCNIEILSVSEDTAWILSIPTESTQDTVLLLSGLLYGKVNRIQFADRSRTAVLSASDGYALALEGRQIAVTKVWLETVLGMLLEVCLQGWTDTAHLDQDFHNVSVTIAVLPPDK